MRTSNIPAVSFGECTSYSIARVLCSASTSLAAAQDRANADQRSQSGRIASVVSNAMKVANASFSQIPFHQRIVTRFPNHWWASSCATTSAMFSSSCCVAWAGSTRSTDSR